MFLKMQNKLDAKLIKTTLLTLKYPKHNFSILNKLISTIKKTCFISLRKSDFFM